MAFEINEIGKNRKKAWKWTNRQKSRMHRVRTWGPQRYFGGVWAQLRYGKMPGRRFRKKILVQLLYLGILPFCTWFPGLVINLKVSPNEWTPFITPVAGSDLHPEKVSDSPNFSSDFLRIRTFSSNVKVNPVFLEMDTTHFTGFFLSNSRHFTIRQPRVLFLSDFFFKKSHSSDCEKYWLTVWLKIPMGDLWIRSIAPDWLMIAFITSNNNLVPLLEVLCSSNPCRFEFSFWGVLPESNRRPRDRQSRALTN